MRLRPCSTPDYWRSSNHTLGGRHGYFPTLHTGATPAPGTMTPFLLPEGASSVYGLAHAPDHIQDRALYHRDHDSLRLPTIIIIFIFITCMHAGSMARTPAAPRHAGRTKLLRNKQVGSFSTRCAVDHMYMSNFAHHHRRRRHHIHRLLHLLPLPQQSRYVLYIMRRRNKPRYLSSYVSSVTGGSDTGDMQASSRQRSEWEDWFELN